MEQDRDMTTSAWVKVARFHLSDRVSYTALPGIILMFFFAFWLVLAAATQGHHPWVTGTALAYLYLFFAFAGTATIGRSLPFALALGIGRRSYYAGTVLLAVSLDALYGLVLALLQVIERATNGWGLGLHCFRVAYILDGPWYLTWLTSFVGLSLMFLAGMWLGLVYRRWNVFGVLAIVAAITVVMVAGIVITSNAHAWSDIGHFFVTIGAAGVTGILAVIGLVLLVSGYATIRRVAV